MDTMNEIKHISQEEKEGTVENCKPSATYWGDRKLIPVNVEYFMSDNVDAENMSVVSILTMNIMCQNHATAEKRPHCQRKYLNWNYRSQQLLKEIVSYDADIICLQELDYYEDFWRGNLNVAGYDSLYHKREGYNNDGVAIAYRRNQFQLFRSEKINLREAGSLVKDENLAARIGVDNVAIITALQPWEDSTFPSGLCVATTQLSSHLNSEELRLIQTVYLSNAVESFNSDFQLPVVICGTFNALPGSDVYHVMSTGYRKSNQKPPRPPEKPQVSKPSNSTITVNWSPPQSIGTEIDNYKIIRRMANNPALGYHNEQEVGNINEVVVTMLSSGVNYQFKVAARNKYGWSSYSKPSDVISTTRLERFRGGESISKELSTRKTLDEEMNYERIIIDTGSSGRTPRFVDGSIDDKICPRPTLLDGKHSTMKVTGEIDSSLAHYSCYKSAYVHYQDNSEPEYTFSSPYFTGTIDYIFHSARELIPCQLLTIPEYDSLNGMDVRQPQEVPDPENPIPEDWDEVLWKERKAKGINAEPLSPIINPNYMGKWICKEIVNEKIIHHWLPNQTYTSDHIALMVVLAYDSENLISTWH